MAQDTASYKAWKSSIPFLYDWFANHHLTWPSLCCRWGPQTGQGSYKSTQRLYSSERTDDPKQQLLIVSSADIAKPRTAAAEHIVNFKEMDKSRNIKPVKAILHPGEVNKIRDLGTAEHKHMVVTHTDAKETYVWNMDTQASHHRGPKGTPLPAPNTPDLTLTGHEDTAQYALSCSTAAPLVSSGGTDHNVLVWDLRDHDNGSLLQSSANGTAAASASPMLPAKSILQGHGDTVEDLVFRPGSAEELVSVGDDKAVLLWDRRTGSQPVVRVHGAHGDNDLHTVDWSGQDSTQIATGAADGTLKVWDRRKLGLGGSPQALLSLALHKQAIMRVEFMPTAPGVLASGGEDGAIAVWNLAAAAEGQNVLSTVMRQEEEKGIRMPPQLLFQHFGHRHTVVDFQWHPQDPYTMMSVSEDEKGGTIQLWRICDMIYRPEKEVLAELEQHRQTIIHGQAQEAKPERGQRSATPSASLAAATPAASTEAGNNHPPQQAPDSAHTIGYAAAPGIIRVGVKDEGPSTQDAVMADLAAVPAADAAAAPAAADAANLAPEQAASGGV